MNQEPTLKSAQEIISLIDLTRLDKHATVNELNDLVRKANDHQPAAICIFPEHYACISEDIKVNRATVVNFPTGEEPIESVLQAIDNAKGIANEIDYVFPYKRYLSGDSDKALAHCHRTYLRCQNHQLLFKVILESGAFSSMDHLYELSLAVVQSGCDFLKTSTGTILTGATLPAMLAMASAIIDSKKNCGIKVSGGIKTRQQALAYIQRAEQMFEKKVDNTWFRIGASGLLDELTKNQCPPHH